MGNDHRHRHHHHHHHEDEDEDEDEDEEEEEEEDDVDEDDDYYYKENILYQPPVFQPDEVKSSDFWQRTIFQYFFEYPLVKLQTRKDQSGTAMANIDSPPGHQVFSRTSNYVSAEFSGERILVAVEVCSVHFQDVLLQQARGLLQRLHLLFLRQQLSRRPRRCSLVAS